MKACFIASSGGHWEALMCIKPIADEYDTVYITEDGGQARDSSLENIHLLPQINRRQKDFLWRFLKLMISAGKIMLREKPDFIVLYLSLSHHIQCILTYFLHFQCL